jgi:hypothetical protein
MSELRRNLELLVNAVRNSRDQKAIDENALRIELREIFLPIIGLLHSSLRYLQKPYQGNIPSSTPRYGLVQYQIPAYR